MRVTIDLSETAFSRLAMIAHNNNKTVQQVVTSILESTVTTTERPKVREEDLPEVEFY